MNSYGQVGGFPSAARTASISGTAMQNPYRRGVVLTLNVTVRSGTGGLQLRVQTQDPVSGAWISMNSSPTAVIATGTFVYQFYPGVSGSALAQAYGAVLPYNWRVVVTHGDATSYTYSIGYQYVI